MLTTLSKFKPCANPECKVEAKPDYPFCWQCQWMLPDRERMDMHRAQRYKNEAGHFPKNYISRLGKAISALNKALAERPSERMKNDLHK